MKNLKEQKKEVEVVQAVDDKMSEQCWNVVSGMLKWYRRHIPNFPTSLKKDYQALFCHLHPVQTNLPNWFALKNSQKK
jgi:hypothetical protein